VHDVTNMIQYWHWLPT